MLLSIVELGHIDVLTVLVTVVVLGAFLLTVAFLTRGYRRKQVDRVLDRFMSGLQASTAELARAHDIAGVLAVIERTESEVRAYLATKQPTDAEDVADSHPANEGHF